MTRRAPEVKQIRGTETVSGGTANTPAFRSFRRRFIALITPLAILTAAVLALISARAVRGVATPIILQSTENFLDVLSDRLQNTGGDDETLRIILEKYVVSGSMAFVLVENGKVKLTVGRSQHIEQCVDDGFQILEIGECGSLVHDHGPLGTWMTVARKLGPGRFLLLERRVDGPGSLYTVAAIGVSVATLLISLLFATTLSWVLFRPVAIRLGALQSALMRYEAGDHDVRLLTPGDRRNEWDEVDQAFNRLAERIEGLEEERRHQAEMKRALLADLAHDINTPIAVLRGYAEILVDKGAGMEQGDLRKVYSRLLAQSYFVQAIVDDLLTMADARENQLRLTPEEISCDELFDVISDAFDPLVSQKGIALIGDAGGLKVVADPIRLRQILNNLIRNAILHAKGALVIEMGAYEEAEGIVISVEDDGPGLPEEMVSRLFERKQRGADPGGPGWGLGLAIVKTLMDLHGGLVRYRAASPGARFELFFPEGK